MMSLKTWSELRLSYEQGELHESQIQNPHEQFLRIGSIMHSLLNYMNPMRCLWRQQILKVAHVELFCYVVQQKLVMILHQL